MRTAVPGPVRTLLAGIIALLLIGDAAIVGARLNDDSDRSDRGAKKPPPSAAALQNSLPELIAFVEQARGLKFERPPTVELLSDKDFEALLRNNDEGGSEPTEQGLDDYVKVLRAFGLVQGGVDLNAVVDEEVGSTVGFYDSHTKKLYARGVEPTPYVKMVLVHELTHALDDQHFNIDREDLDDEADAAFTALVEGNARRIEQRWVESRPKAEQDAIEAEDAGGDEGGDAPDVFTELFAFPYIVGPDFVQALLDAGGQAKLDDAFAHPPTTTEQVIHPEKYLAGEGARAVAAPKADGPVVDEGTNGELGLILVLDSAVDRATALRAAAGWGGDSYVAWTAGNRTCFRWNIVMDSTKDTNEAVNALRSWAAANPGASVRGTNPIVVANCA